MTNTLPILFAILFILTFAGYGITGAALNGLILAHGKHESKATMLTLTVIMVLSAVIATVSLKLMTAVYIIPWQAYMLGIAMLILTMLSLIKNARKAIVK